jgi:hypothetical protein
MAQPTYSLWLVPEGAQRARLQGLIDSHAAAHALPSFAAHVTLLPQFPGALPQLLEGCKAIQAAARGALAVPMAEAVAAGLDAAHWRFRCVYLLAAAPHPPALLALRAAAVAALGLPPQQGPYMPHLSLAYSECDAATRSAWAAQAREGALAALGGPGAPLLCAAIELWETSSPDPAQWARVAAFPLPPAEGQQGP